MAYYWLDKFPEEKVSELSDLCQNLGLVEEDCSLPEKQWSGENSGRRYDLQIIRYSPQNRARLLIQSYSDSSILDTNFKNFLKKVLVLAEISYFYHGGIIDSATRIELQVLE